MVPKSALELNMWKRPVKVNPRGRSGPNLIPARWGPRSFKNLCECVYVHTHSLVHGSWAGTAETLEQRRTDAEGLLLPPPKSRMRGSCDSLGCNPWAVSWAASCHSWLFSVTAQGGAPQRLLSLPQEVARVWNPRCLVWRNRLGAAAPGSPSDPKIPRFLLPPFLFSQAPGLR